MTYNAAIPQSTDRPSQSQPQLLTNFSQLNLLFNVDHVTYDDAAVADRGKHRQVHIRSQSGDASTAANEGAIYIKNNTLYYREQSNGNIIEMIGGSGGGIPTPGSNGSTILPGGIILKWGSQSGFSLSGTIGPGPTVGLTPAQTFAGGAFPNNCWSVICNIGSTSTSPPNSNTAAPVNITTNSFQGSCVYNTNSTNFIYYVAIGN